MNKQIKVNNLSNLLKIFIQDSSASDGRGLTGLVYNSSGLQCNYIKDGQSTVTAVGLVDTTVGTYTDSGFKEVDAAYVPGWYELQLPDAAFDTPGQLVVHLRGATNMVDRPLEFEIVGYNPYDGQRLGLTALPAVDIGQPGSIPVITAAGYIDVTIVRWNISGATTLSAPPEIVRTVTLQNSSSTSVTLDSGASTTDDYYTGLAVVVTEGWTGVGQAERIITAYNGTTKVATVVPAWTTTPASNAIIVLRLAGSNVRTSGTSFKQPGESGGILISGSNAGTTTLAALTISGTATVAALTISGLFTVSGVTSLNGLSIVGVAITAGMTITNANGNGLIVQSTGSNGSGVRLMGNGSGDGIKCVAGGTGVDIRGNITGNITGTVDTVTTVTALSTAAYAAAADKLLGRNLAGGSDGTRTVQDALRFLRNKWSISGTTLTVCAEDDTTTAWSSTITVTAGANPVTANDPA